MWSFVLLRVRAHRLLLTAALLAVVLTTSVVAMLGAFSTAIGDASLRHTLRTRDRAATALVVRADVTAEQRRAADAAVDKGARRTFDGLPLHQQTLITSGPYALPGTPRGGKPDLTNFAVLERSEVKVTSGRLPRARAGSVVEAAIPRAAAAPLKLGVGDRFVLTDRFGGPKITVELTGVYRPARPQAAYWTVDELRGRGVRKLGYTTYGPLLADPSVVAGGRVSDGQSAWLTTADFSTLTTDRLGELRDAARAGPRALLHSKGLAGATEVRTALPDVLDKAERALLVARSTLLIVALQLVLLAGYALLLVARLLNAERTGETWMLRARGGSRGRVAGLAAAESLLLALPAVVCAPLLAGPLTQLVASQGALSRIGLRLDTSGSGGSVWLVSVAVAVGCALAVTAPALTDRGARRERARTLPAPVRAGADIGLLLVAGVAYWQLDRQTSDAGALSGNRSGTLGIDPLLVVAPALALLAGTVLTLRLLPPVARLAERRAASGRGLPAALAGWQFSRRPMRGAGPVLLLVLAVAMGMLAIGQGASWDRSQDDQADFRSGAPIRVLATETGMDQAARYASVPGVRDAAPAYRATLPLNEGRTATLLALDTAHAHDGLMLRGDLTDTSPRRALAAITPKPAPVPGVRLPAGTTRAVLTLRGTTNQKDESDQVTTVSATVRDRYGLAYRTQLDELPLDGRGHRVSLDLGPAAGPLTLTGLDFDTDQPSVPGARHRITLEAVSAPERGGGQRPLSLTGTRWKASLTGRETSAPGEEGAPTKPKVGGAEGSGVSLSYAPGHESGWAGYGARPAVNVRLVADRPAVTEVAALATDRYLASADAHVGSRLDVDLGGGRVRVRIAASVRALPTTGPEAGAESGAGSTTATGAGASAAKDGGGLLLDLRDLNAAVADPLAPNEWWLYPAAGGTERAVAALRSHPDLDPAQVTARSEIAEELHDDPLGAGPQSALAAAALAAAALAAVGFAVSTAGSLRERGDEFAVLSALGASRRRLARLVAAEQGALVALGLLVGAALGILLTRAVVPLIVLTGEATRPVPDVLVRLPVHQVALLLLGVAAVPALITAVLALRRPPSAANSLRVEGGE
ncbi:FtsX-like permease family protein [Streptomyces sp. NPDC051684]|uniref:FtsX-like permease family protein n=1 Tax=Streptomyces sp. NPDC051684 TaxID=3365670 RepID=UPI0037BC1F91